MKLENLQTIAFIKERIKKSYEHRELKNRPICIVGHQGTAKSEAVKQCANELGVGFIIAPFQSADPSDFMGLMKIEGDKTEYKRPAWFPADGKGIFFIDEINRIQRDIIACFYTLILNREINGHKLGDDWIIVAAANPSECPGESYDVMELDAAMIGRFRFYGVLPDVEGFTNYLYEKYGPNSLVYQFILADPSVVSFEGKRGSPRDFEFLHISSIENDFEHLSVPDIKSVACSDIGLELSASFASFLNLRTYCTPQMILKSDWCVCESGLKKAKDNGRFDIETAIMRGIADLYIKTKDGNIDNIVSFMELVGAEKAITMLQLMTNIVKKSYEKDQILKLKNLIEHARKRKSKIFKWAEEIVGEKGL